MDFTSQTFMKSKLPLPPRYFRCPDLQKDQQQVMIDIAKQSHANLVETANMNNGPIHWIPISSSNGSTSVFKATFLDSNPVPKDLGCKTEYMCGVSTLNATLDEVVRAHSLDTTDQFRKGKKVYDSNILDCCVLYTLIERNDANLGRYCGIKWSAHAISLPLVRNLDFSYFEHQDYFTASNGRRGWAYSLNSVRIGSCPSLEKSHDLSRGSYYDSGCVFTETDTPGVLDVMCILHMKAKGFIPRWVLTQILKNRFLAIEHVDKLIMDKRMNNQTYLKPKDLVPKKFRKKCNVCSNFFNMLSKKCQCRLCGEVACLACSRTWSVNLPVVGKMKVRICSPCSFEAQRNSFKPGNDHAYSASVDCTGIDHRYTGAIGKIQPQSTSTARHTLYY